MAAGSQGRIAWNAPFIKQALLFVTLGLSILAPSDVPRMLLAPTRKSATGPVPNASLANFLAQALDDDGRIFPIVWGLTDPAFRDAAMAGKLGKIPDYPSAKESYKAAKSLGAAYLLIYSTERKGKGLVAEGQLYYDGRRVWKNVETMGSVVGGRDNPEDTAASIAHTWAVMLFNSALKTLAPHPKAAIPKPAPGREPSSGQPRPAPGVAKGMTSVTAEAESLAKAGKLDAAVLMLRDAIDADPMDPKRRLLLISLLQRKGDSEAAASAALQGANLIPGSAELRLTAVRSLISLGRMQEAKEQVNELLARNPHDPAAVLLQARTALLTGDAETAVQILDRLIGAVPSPAAYYWRAVTRSLLGGAEGVDADLDAYAKQPLPADEAETAFFECTELFDAAEKKAFADTLEVLRLLSIHPADIEARQSLERLVRQSQARSEFWDRIATPANCRTSSGHRQLAQKLLSITLVDAKAYVEAQDDDTMTDARINLGESIKETKAAQEALRLERDRAIGVTAFTPALQKAIANALFFAR